jgi:hypothetical protein
MHLPLPRSRSRLAATLAVLAALTASGHRLRAQLPAPGPVVAVVAVDGRGRQVTDLQPGDVSVTIDGRPRSARSVRYVPGADGTGRSIIVAVDEESVLRGDEARVRAVVNRLAQRLDAGDRLALLALPMPRGPIVLTPDREAIAGAVALVRGRASRAALMAQADDLGLRDPDVRVSDEVEPDRTQGGGEDRPARSPVNAPSSGGTVAPAPSAADAAAPADRGTRPAGPLEGLSRFLQRLGGSRGRRTLLWLTGSFRAADGPREQAVADVQRELAECVDAAARADATIHVVHVNDAGGSRGRTEMDALASGTGGLVLRASGKDQDFDRLLSALSGHYRVELEPAGREADDRVRSVQIASARRGISVLAARRWVAHDEAPANEPADSPTPTAAVAGPAPAVPAPPAGPATAAPGNATPPVVLAGPADPELAAVLTRAVDYVSGYLRDFSNVVAEELYFQHLGFNSVGASAVSRRLRSDLLLLATPNSGGWTPFRDVFEVDGAPVRNREERLRKLFLEKPESAYDEGRRLTEESARYNIGRVQRTINVPTLPLLFLTNQHIRNFRFRLRRADAIDGVAVVRLDFSEVGRPTIVQQVRQNRVNGDSPSIGSLWVERETGRIVRTLLRVGDGSSRLEATVVYRPNHVLGLWTPFEMKETYATRLEMIFGEATYSNFRRFQVTTEEKVTVPK